MRIADREFLPFERKIALDSLYFEIRNPQSALRLAVQIFIWLCG